MIAAKAIPPLKARRDGDSSRWPSHVKKRQHHQEHQALAERDVRGAVGADHHARRLVLPPARTEGEVLVEPDEHARREPADERGRPGAPGRPAKQAVQPHRDVPELDDDARPGKRHVERGLEQHGIARQVDQTPRHQQANQDIVGEDLEEPRHEPEAQHLVEVLAARPSGGLGIERQPHRHGQVGEDEPVAGKHERRRQREAETDGVPREPHRVGARPQAHEDIAEAVVPSPRCPDHRRRRAAIRPRPVEQL